VIARIWNGSTSHETAGPYLAHLREHTFPELRRISGHRGAFALRRANGATVRFTVITLWDSIDAIRQFAGDDTEAAVVPAAAPALLTSYEPRATHWEVVLDNPALPGAK
jgi:heme-degrading monooxygenase HmoA